MTKEKLEQKLYSWIYTQIENIDMNASKEVQDWDIENIDKLLKEYSKWFETHYDFAKAYSQMEQDAKKEYYITNREVIE